jgi:hypothetical protein
MSSVQRKTTYLAAIAIAAMLSNFTLAQPQTTASQSAHPSRVSVVYVPPHLEAKPDPQK